MPTKTAKTTKKSTCKTCAAGKTCKTAGKTCKTAGKACCNHSKKSCSVAARVESASPRVVEVSIPDSYAPISMWGYFAYTILFAIPVIGWIFCIYFAFMASNHNLKNFARSQFCLLIIYVAAIVILAALGLLSDFFQIIINNL